MNADETHATCSSETSNDLQSTPSWPVLNTVEARVLGALIEKQLTTPDYYPLTLNALLAACNQKNNRDPVTAFDEPTVLAATESLREKKLAWQVFLAGNRVPKFRHAITDIYHVPEETVPSLCELLLRGPQTAAELRGRTERMGVLPANVDVELILQQLVTHQEGPFAVKLPREPGRREQRYAHLLCGPVAVAAMPAGAPGEPIRVTGPQNAERLTQLEATVAGLQTRFEALEAKLAQLL